MAETKQGLVLHLAGAVQPLHIALDTEEARTLADRLTELVASGQTKALATADGGYFTVNFAHVATAHIENTRSDANSYGSPARGAGFGS